MKECGFKLPTDEEPTDFEYCFVPSILRRDFLQLTRNPGVRWLFSRWSLIGWLNATNEHHLHV